MTQGKTRFPRESRISHAEEFRKIFHDSKRISRSGVALYRGVGKTGTQSRLGIVVSKKAIRLATGRNRVKRVVREFFRRHQREFKMQGDFILRVVDGSKFNQKKDLRGLVQVLFMEIG